MIFLFIKQIYGESKPSPYGISGEIFVGRGLAPAACIELLCEFFTAPIMHIFRALVSESTEAPGECLTTL